MNNTLNPSPGTPLDQVFLDAAMQVRELFGTLSLVTFVSPDLYPDAELMGITMQAAVNKFAGPIVVDWSLPRRTAILSCDHKCEKHLVVKLSG